MSYNAYFPDFPPLPYPVPMGFRDVTDKADPAPRFCDPASNLELHIHHPEASKRDLPTSPQYLLFHAIGRQVVCESDNWTHILRAIENAQFPIEDQLSPYFNGENIGQDVEIVEVASLDEEHSRKFSLPWLLSFADGRNIELDSEDEACRLQLEWRAKNALLNDSPG